MQVTHCLCEKRSIAEILAWARARGVDDVEPIKAGMGCGTHCGMCIPFIEYALATGESVIPYPCPDLPTRTVVAQSSLHETGWLPQVPRVDRT